LHRRWSVPVMATLGRDGPSRFSDLNRRLPRASRDTLAETLRHLVAEGVVDWVESGSQARYVLTARGERLVDACQGAVNAVAAAGLVSLALKKWPMLVLTGMGRGARRYGELAEIVSGISPRALSGALRDLRQAELVERGADGRYGLTSKGEELLPAMERLVGLAEE
jgi:DNA-binding HxlR family transcriptional regulator